jgi:hypothetical protein
MLPDHPTEPGFVSNPGVATRRSFLEHAGGLGAALAAVGAGLATALPAQAAATTGAARRSPGLEGPYLDLRTGRCNQLAYARIQGDVDWGKQKYFWFNGYIMGVEPQKRIRNLLGATGFGAIRMNQRPDGVIERLCREIILYTDLESGEVIPEWKNPITGETVKVVHVDNDPFNYLIEDFYPMPPSHRQLPGAPPPVRRPFVLPWHQHGRTLAMETHIHLAFPNPLQPDQWPRESAGPVAQVSEMFAHHIPAADMQNPKITGLEYDGVWNRITPWLPWMLMGQRPGMCQYACFMGGTRDLESVLDRKVLDYAEKHYRKYFDAPAAWTGQPSISSLEYYAKLQTPAPVRAEPKPASP